MRGSRGSGMPCEPVRPCPPPANIATPRQPARPRPWSAVAAACLIGCAPDAGEVPPSIELDCERRGYPCTWAEVDPSVQEATRTAWVRLAARMEESRSPADVAAFAREIPDVVEADAGDLAVRFRLQGGRPYWVFLPYDPAFPIEGAAPSSGAREGAAFGSTAMGDAPAPLVRAMLRTVQADERMDPVGEPGEGKKALVLSPFEWQFASEGGKAAPVAEVIASIDDYQPERGGQVTFHANIDEEVPIRLMSSVPFDFRQVQADVTLDDFLHWHEYQYIYLSTHGAEVCPREPAGTPCHTVLMAGRASQADLERADAIPGIDRTGSLTGLNPDLGTAERERCIRDLQQGDMQATSAAGTPCLHDEPLSYEILLLTTDFFRARYPQGLRDAIIFLAACQSTRAGDLVLHLTGNNRNVVVFGFDEVVRTDQASAIGVRTAQLLRDRYSNDEIERTLNREFADQPFWGLVQSSGSAPAGLLPAKLTSTGGTSTYGRDIIRLLDPGTGEPLEDGASLRLVGARGDGAPDSVRVTIDLGRLDPELADPALYDVSVAVLDRPASDATYRLEERFDEHTVRRTGPVALGFDVEEGQTVDLEVSATLPGGGETRWTYRDLRLPESHFIYAATGDLDLSAEGEVAGIVGVRRRATGECELTIPLSSDADHSLRLVARLPDGLREGAYPIGPSYRGNADANVGSLSSGFERVWLHSVQTLPADIFHAELLADPSYGTDDRPDAFLSRTGRVTVEEFDGARIALSFSMDMVQATAEGEYTEELSPDAERLLAEGYPFGSDAAKRLGAQEIERIRSAYAQNPARRSATVTGQLSHVIQNRVSGGPRNLPDLYACGPVAERD